MSDDKIIYKMSQAARRITLESADKILAKIAREFDGAEGATIACTVFESLVLSMYRSMRENLLPGEEGYASFKIIRDQFIAALEEIE